MDEGLIAKLEDENKSLKSTIKGLEETWGTIVGFLIKEVIKSFGKEGRKVVKEAMRNSGLWIGSKYIKNKKIKKKGIQAFANYFKDISDVEIFNVKIDESNDKKFVIRTYNCPYLKYWKELGIDKELPDFCSFTTAADLGIAQAFNKDIAIKLEKNMLIGDECCIYSFESKNKK